MRELDTEALYRILRRDLPLLTWRYRALRALRAIVYWLALNVSPALFSGLYFRLAFACLDERRRALGFTSREDRVAFKSTN